ncbi:hypothetical protein EYR40_007690 [Pleurotus pulmonarius]|nr:hypothetical protein EYR40_007690 [Pleurotus pulmonarius]
MTREEMYKAKNRTLAMYTSAVIIAAVGVTYAAVPLYRMFCAATGFAGTPKVGTGRFESSRLVPVDGAKRIKVHFNADKSGALPWTFTPQQKFVSVLPGESSLAFYSAKNTSDQDIIGIATYNVTPDRVAPYFSKVECFCFEEQKLLAGEEVDMPLLFFIDKDILDDPTCRNVDDVVLSYTFFRARRNRQGHLEPDAPEDVVQQSLGFDKYEHGPKREATNDMKNFRRASRVLSNPQTTQMRTKTGVASSGPFNNLPRLPVPPLRKTLDRYLKSIEPFLLEDEAKGGQPFYDALALRTKWADEFERGIGTVCQERLLALDKESPHNWLDDNFWLDKAYMEWRAPLVVNSNWWLVFAHDKSIPQPPTSSRAGITPWQVRRAAWLVHRTLQYKDTIAATASSDNTRTGIWLRENIARIFNVCRIPQPQRDVLAPAPPPSSAATRCIVVTVHNWFYLVEAFVDHELLPVSALEHKLRAVVRDAAQRLQRGEKAPRIGALSADERDKWAANLSHLLSVSEQNKRTHESIVHSLIGLSLDDTTHSLHRSPDALPPSLSSASSSFDPTHPSQLELDAHLHTIRSTTANVSNRFFDKAYTIIVDPSARAGATGEHSPVDALVPSIVGEYSVVQDIDQGAFNDTLSSDIDSAWFDNETNSNGWSRLNWDTDAYIEKECDEAVARAKAIIEDSDDSVLWFCDYGTDWIKTVAQMAPDAYIQQALQLAWYRTRGSFTATYETTLTRMFKHGRTETIRTHTNDSRAWVLAMMDPRCSPSQCAALLHRAIAAHTSLTREAATGRGIDRHLMGLQLLLKPANGERSELFSDNMFQRSSTWKLSTSGLSAGYLFRGTGFGAQYEDGYGINYLAAADQIKFGIESKHSSSLTSTALFQTAVVDSLHDMKLLFEPQRQLISHL